MLDKKNFFDESRRRYDFLKDYLYKVEALWEHYILFFKTGYGKQCAWNKNDYLWY